MEQERDAQGQYIDPITLESIPKEMQVQVNGLYLSVETLYTTYVKTGKLEDPFTRTALNQDVEKRVLAYGETRKICFLYQEKEYKHDYCTALGEAVKRIIYEDETFTKEDLYWEKQSLLEKDLTLPLESLGAQKLHIHKQKEMSEQGKENLLAYLHKESSGVNSIIAGRISGEQTMDPMSVISRLLGLAPGAFQVVYGDTDSIVLSVQMPMPSQGDFDGDEVDISAPQQNIDWHSILHDLQGAPEEDILSPLEEGINRRLTNAREFYVSLLGDAGMRPSRLLEHICSQGGPTLRHNLLTVLWFGRGGLQCTNVVFPYLAALRITNTTAREHRLDLVRQYFQRHGVPDMEETHIVPDVLRLVREMRA